MPAYARHDIVDEERVGVYHCIARCVRRAFLCGVDPYTGRDYNHRKEWVLSRLRQLAGVFGIEVCSYTVMSNHIHLVLRNRPDVTQRWSSDEVALRWRTIFPVRDEATGEPIEPEKHDLAMLTADATRLAELRGRLGSLSWFMRCLCERIARKGNQEDQVSGRFWEGRFRSQLLLDEAAILACSVYVDLNPIRAGIAETPEESDYTSGLDRIRDLCVDEAGGAPPSVSGRSVDRAARSADWLCELTLEEATTAPAPSSVMGEQSEDNQAGALDCSSLTPDLPVVSDRSDSATPAGATAHVAHKKPKIGPRASDQGFLPIEIKKYLMLLDWTGRELRRDKRGAIPDHLAPILDRLGLERTQWVETVRDFGRMFKQAAGRWNSLRQEAPRCSRRWFQGKSAARLAFL
jgi:REP element-mobilizing transposase RayT